MFEAKLALASQFKRLAEALHQLVNQANFNVGKDGISMHAMDQSHVCLVALEMTSDMFQLYRCDRPMVMGINMGNLLKILKCAGTEDSITLKADDDGDVLTLMFESSKQERVSDFELKLLSIDGEMLQIPDQDYAAAVVLPSSEYQRICRDLSTIGDTVSISALRDNVKLSTSGDVGSANITLRHYDTSEKDEEHILIEVSEPVSLTFALRYLATFAKATPLSPRVKLGLTRDLPIAVEYALPDNSWLKFFLAPKIEDEDDSMAPDEGESSKPVDD